MISPPPTSHFLQYSIHRFVFVPMKFLSVLSRSNSSKGLRVTSSDERLCTKRQDAVLPKPYPRDETKSQYWNEKSYIHCLRMMAMALDGAYQKAVREVCEEHGGMFRVATIKGFGRMANKCVSKEDHYHEAYPRLIFPFVMLTRVIWHITFLCSCIYWTK